MTDWLVGTLDRDSAADGAGAGRARAGAAPVRARRRLCLVADPRRADGAAAARHDGRAELPAASAGSASLATGLSSAPDAVASPSIARPARQLAGAPDRPVAGRRGRDAGARLASISRPAARDPRQLGADGADRLDPAASLRSGARADGVRDPRPRRSSSRSISTTVSPSASAASRSITSWPTTARSTWSPICSPLSCSASSGSTHWPGPPTPLSGSTRKRPAMPGCWTRSMSRRSRILRAGDRQGGKRTGAAVRRRARPSIHFVTEADDHGSCNSPQRPHARLRSGRRRSPRGPAADRDLGGRLCRRPAAAPTAPALPQPACRRTRRRLPLRRLPRRCGRARFRRPRRRIAPAPCLRRCTPTPMARWSPRRRTLDKGSTAFIGDDTVYINGKVKRLEQIDPRRAPGDPRAIAKSAAIARARARAGCPRNWRRRGGRLERIRERRLQARDRSRIAEDLRRRFGRSRSRRPPSFARQGRGPGENEGRNPQGPAGGRKDRYRQGNPPGARATVDPDKIVAEHSQGRRADEADAGPARPARPQRRTRAPLAPPALCAAGASVAQAGRGRPLRHARAARARDRAGARAQSVGLHLFRHPDLSGRRRTRSR